MKVKELLAKLQQYIKTDPSFAELPVLIEPNIDVMDAEGSPWDLAYSAYNDKLPPITLYTAMAQMDTYTQNGEEQVEHFFVRALFSEDVDEYEDRPDDKKVLVISSPSFKYGAEKDDVKS